MKRKLTALMGIIAFGATLFGSAYAAEGGNMQLLTPRQQQLAHIGALTAAGDTDGLKTVLNDALNHGLTVNEARDAMVQLYAYTGFPRSLNALSALAQTVQERQDKGLKTKQGRTAAPLPPDTDMLALGTKTQTDLIGQKVDLSALSPDIDRYLKTHLFGDIFASDLLNWQEREIITIAALNRLKGAESQLNSHIAVGKKNGLSDEQIQAITQTTGNKMNDLSQFAVGKPNDAYAKYFTGPSYLNPLSTEQVGVYNVTFEPTVRNNWHIHHASKGGGQILIVTAGRGYYQEWGKPAQELKAGDTVNIPANIKHWHGAAKDSWFQHLAIEVPGENTSNEWLEPVSDADYGKLK